MPSGQRGSGSDDPRRVAVEALLARHVPLSPAEQRAVATIRTAITAGATALDGHAKGTHLVASAIIVDTDGAHVVLIHHRRLQRWIQPGGHLLAGEAPHEAASREAREETGLQVAPHETPPSLVHVDVHPAHDGHRHLDLRFLFQVDGRPAPMPDAAESQQARWMPVVEAMRHTDQSLQAALRATLVRLGEATTHT